MNFFKMRGEGRSVSLLALLWMILLLLTVSAPSCFGKNLKPSVPPEEVQRLGERMYRDGILPSGGRIQVVVNGEHAIPGTTFTCESCHLRSGLGAFDEGLYVPATNGARLYQPLLPQLEKTGSEQSRRLQANTHRRPAYTDATLARALRNGVDGAGRKLNEAMPRYRFSDDDMAIMISYLKTLSSQNSPGASPAVIKFATVITDDVKPEDGDAMLMPLLGFIDTRNRQARLYQQVKGSGKGSFTLMRDDMMTSTSQPMSLSVWRLKGPSDTWRRQLDEYYRAEPVFALLGGISKQEWLPVHQFAEDNRIPSLFPYTDFPALSHNDWYTFYLSRGYVDEGEAAARFLEHAGARVKGKRVVQVVRDSREGRALAQGFQTVWQDLGHEAPVTLTLKAGEELKSAVLKPLLADDSAALLLWDGPEALPVLDSLAGLTQRPDFVVISSTYVGNRIRTLKESLRDFTYITYRKEANQGELLSQLLTMALMDMKGNYYRDQLLDVIGMLGELELRPHGRLTFGATQRYVSKANIAQLSKGDKPALITKSDGAN